MNNILVFLSNYYEKAIKLSDDFNKTREHDWNPLIILNELGIQIGQIYNIAYRKESINENNRVFLNFGDELCDVILQLISLANSMGFNLYEIEYFQSIPESNCISLPILFGQLNESIMEKYGYRFRKDREGFLNIDDFIKDRLFRLFDITFQIADFYNINMENEFQMMLEDANHFLIRFMKENINRELVSKMIKKMARIVKIDQFLHRGKYNNDNYQTKYIVNIKKDNINYYIIDTVRNVNNDLHFVFVIIESENCILTHQMSKNFYSSLQAKRYVDSLKCYIRVNSNEILINHCYKELPSIFSILFPAFRFENLQNI